ncbi:Uncharacterised protein [Kluyvera cryocrescens]|uniref:Uncharacterized protein n=1 Tax=Kluyvera cryocrescens TaxID=580 RepID=A0A485B3X8_KLUCR|nr:Uncharacterised protein [Kluyvera cryocrescens]
MQPNNDLYAIAASYDAVCAQCFKDVVALSFRHIHQRDAQSGGAVVDALNVGGSPQCLQDACGLARFRTRSAFSGRFAT